MPQVFIGIKGVNAVALNVLAEVWLRERTASIARFERVCARLKLRDDLQAVAEWLWRETYKPVAKQDALGIKMARKFIAETRAELADF